MKTKDDTQEIYRRYAVLLSEAKALLQDGKKLKPAGWLATAALYPNQAAPQGAGMQVFRANWFNDSGNGIHFETWMKKSYHEEGQLPFVLHVEVGKARAGFGQKDFQKLFLARAGAELEGNGYKLNHGYAMEPIKTFRRFTADTFVTVVAGEFRFLSKFGGVIDSIIEELKAAQPGSRR